jgi:L1 cell adhesion molecule like protein
MSEKISIGIDLGTTHCCVGVFKDGKVHIVPNENGNRSTPSYVAFTDEGVLIGDAAKSQVSRNPNNTVYDTKNIIGAIAKDPGSLQYIQRMWPFELTSDTDGLVRIKVVNRGVEETYTPEEISGMILSKLREAADGYLGCNVTNAVITVPANCGVIMRKATYLAANLAGLEVLRIINEPTAAAVAYTHDLLSDLTGERHVVVFDLGGGTLDVSLLSIEEGICEVLSSKGASVGGEDFTNNLLMYLVKEFRQREKLSVLDQRAIRRLKKASEETKMALSFQSQVRLDLEALYDGRDFSITVTREMFEEINSSLFATIIDVLSETILSTHQSDKFKEIILVGGSSRIPKIQDLIREHFDFKATLNKRMNFDEAVAAGAAIQAAILSGDKSNSLQDIILLDVCPMSLGVETSGGTIAHIVKVNDTIPMRSCRSFLTSGKQSDMHIKVYEGESEIASENTLVRQFRLTNILPGKLVEILFDIDANGSLAVIPSLIALKSATDEADVLAIDGCPPDLVSSIMEVRATERGEQVGSHETYKTSSTQRTETNFSFCSSSNSSNRNKNTGSGIVKNLFGFGKRKK